MPIDGTEESPSLESTVSADTETVSAETTSTDATSAESSTATDAKQSGEPKLTLKDVVREAVNPKAETSAAEEKAKDPKAETGEDKTSPDKKPDGETSQEEKDKLLPFHKHPRFVELTKELRELKGEGGPVQEIAAITGYMKATNLNVKDVSEALKLTALLKSDPVKARESIVGILSQIDKYVGNELPADLKKDVESGAITEERAKELSQARADKARSTAKATADAEAAKTADVAAQVAEVQKNIRTGVNNWVAATAKTDPDFAKKHSLVLDRVRALVVARQQPVQSAEDGIALAKQAYKDVNDGLAALMPKPKTRIHVDAHSAAGGSAEPPAPKTFKDAVKAGLSR